MRRNHAWPILFLVTACAHVQSPLQMDAPYKYELASPEMDVDAPAPVSEDVIATLPLKDVSADEYAAFQAEAGRLSFHFERRCRLLADETKTLRHEMSHTLGAAEQRIGDEWSARDYAYRCA